MRAKTPVVAWVYVTDNPSPYQQILDDLDMGLIPVCNMCPHMGHKAGFFGICEGNRDPEHANHVLSRDHPCCISLIEELRGEP